MPVPHSVSPPENNLRQAVQKVRERVLELRGEESFVHDSKVRVGLDATKLMVCWDAPHRPACQYYTTSLVLYWVLVYNYSYPLILAYLDAATTATILDDTDGRPGRGTGAAEHSKTRQGQEKEGVPGSRGAQRGRGIEPHAGVSWCTALVGNRITGWAHRCITGVGDG